MTSEIAESVYWFFWAFEKANENETLGYVLRIYDGKPGNDLLIKTISDN